MYPQHPAQQPQQYAPPMPQYPTPNPYPQQQYATPTGYAPPGSHPYVPPAPQPAAPPLPPGSLDSFYQQPSTGGGPSWKFQDSVSRQPMIGKTYEGFVARPVTDSDIEAQTDQSGVVRTYRDGRPKFVMKVPMQFPPTQEHPEGLAQWYVKGQARDELARAMAEAGAPQGPPEAGAWIRVTLVGTRPVPGMNPAYQYRVEYRRPNGAAPAVPVHADQHPNATPQQQVPQGGPVEQYNNPSAPVQPAPYQQAYPAPVQQVVPGAATHVTPVQQPTPQTAPAPVAPQAPAQPAVVAGQAPAGLSPEQAALFAQLTGQKTG
jgi:hypothetical protein